MRLFDDALALAILEYLASTGGVPRKNLYTPFVGYAYRYYAKTVKRLLDEGYLEIYRYERINHIHLTKEGKAALADKEKDVLIREPKSNSAKKKRRQALVVDVVGLCEANEIAVCEAEKPKLAQLFAKPISEETETFFKSKLKTGIFYSSGDIRQAYMQIMGKNEIANWSRLVGIVLLGRSLTFVYSVNRSLIKWMAGSEDRTVKFIIQFLLKSELIRSCIKFYEHPWCIVCGRGFSMVPKIVTGRKWGRVSEDENSERYKARFARDHINAHNLAKVFGAAYYVTSDRRGVDDFKFAAMLNVDTRERLCDKWFSETNTVTRVTAFGKHQGLSSKRERVVYMPYIDLIELEYYKKQGEPCHFVIPAGTQESVSRVMGPLLLSARSLKGKVLTYKRYDSMGALVESQKK